VARTRVSRRPTVTVTAFTEEDEDVEAWSNGALMNGTWPSSGYKGLIIVL